MRYLPSLLLCCAVAGCSSKADAPPPPPPLPLPIGSAAPAPAASTTPVVEIYVNDGSVAKVTAAQLAAWPRLDTLVPQEDRKLGQWGAITLTGADGKTTELKKPFDTYPDMVPALYPAGAGAGFGMYDAVERAKKGTAAMHQDDLKSVKVSFVENGHGGGGDDNSEVGDPTKLVLGIKTAAGESKLAGPQMLALPRQAMPGNNGEVQGWKLAAVLDLAGIKTFEKLLLTDTNGTNLTLEKADFGDASVPFVRINKKGQLKFTVYKKQGAGWTPGAEARSLANVEVTK